MQGILSAPLMRTLEYPKSQIFSSGRGLPSNNVFSSLISRLATPCQEIGDSGVSTDCQKTGQANLLLIQANYNAYHAMQVVDANNQLLKEPPCLTLLQPPFPHHILEHVPA